MSTAPAGGVGGGKRGDRLGTGAGVALQRPQAGVAALGHQQRQGDVLLGQVGERTVAEPMQGPPPEAWWNSASAWR
jgi:hypothetical protein